MADLGVSYTYSLEASTRKSNAIYVTTFTLNEVMEVDAVMISDVVKHTVQDIPGS